MKKWISKLSKKKEKKKLPPQLYDQNGVPILVGDEVLCHRYNLGRSRVELEGVHYFYISIENENEKRISYAKMIDAITGYQKVEKIS